MQKTRKVSITSKSSGSVKRRKKRKGYTKAVRAYFYDGDGGIKRDSLGMANAITVDDVMVMVGLNPLAKCNQKKRMSAQQAIYTVMDEIHKNYPKLVCGGFSRAPTKYTATRLKSEAKIIAQKNAINNFGRIGRQTRRMRRHITQEEIFVIGRANGVIAGMFAKTKQPKQADLGFFLDDVKEA